MIYFLKGNVYSFGVDHLIIDVNGVGYYVNFVHQEQITLGDSVMVFTYHHIREDNQELFGFLDKKEMELFENLISVKGLGPKTAMNMLAHCNYHELIKAIENGDITYITKLPGVGQKTGKQIVLDLKGKLVEDENIESVRVVNEDLQEAIAALKSLGYKAYEVNAVVPELKKKEGLSADGYLKEGLKLLLQRRGG